MAGRLTIDAGPAAVDLTTVTAGGATVGVFLDEALTAEIPLPRRVSGGGALSVYVADATITPTVALASSGAVLSAVAAACGAGVPVRLGPLTNSVTGGVPLASRPTVVGSRAGNAALASLVTQLAALGLVVDGTTA